LLLYLVVGSSSRGVFYFGHAESFVPVLAALGLFHDQEPLRATTFNNPSLADARKFRTSAFAPFSANLAFVLYDCANGHCPAIWKGRSNIFDRSLDAGDSSFVANVSAMDRFFVQLLLNEKPVMLPSLCGRSICSYAELRERYASYIDQCRFSEMCEMPKET